MEFLRSSDTEPTKVLLLLLVDSGQETHQVLYKWDTRYPLDKMRSMSCSGRPLKEDRFPLMLIPSTRPYCFVVVMETGISFYENVHTHEFKRINCRFMKPTAGPLVWVQWAKPRRHTGHLEKRDDLFIVREDGMLQQFLIEKASNLKFNMNFTVGYLDIHVDTAFCMLAGPPGMGGDIFIAAGDMTDGGVYHLPARSVPTRIQVIPNLAPLHDMVIAPQVPGLSSQQCEMETGQPDRLYLCGGQDEEHGEVSEIRYGLEAQMIWTMDCPDANTIDHMWTIEVPLQQKLLFVASHNTHTTVIIFDLETQESEFADATSLPQFDFNSVTLAACLFANHHLIQITQSGVVVIDMSPNNDPRDHEMQDPRNFSHAAIADEGTIALVIRNPGGYEAGVAAIETSETELPVVRYGPSNSILSSRDEVTCLCHVKHGSTSLMIVGTSTTRLVGYYMKKDMTLEPAFESDLTSAGPGIEAAPIASLAVLSPEGSKSSLLLCGLRNGILLCLQMKLGGFSNPNPTLLRHRRLGPTTVEVIPEKNAQGPHTTSSALVLCQSQLHRITLHHNTTTMDFTMSSVWLTNRTDPRAGQPDTSATHRIPQLTSHYTDPGGLLVCAANSELYFASLVTEEQTLAIRRKVEGVPRRILYSNSLNHFVIAVEKSVRVDKFSMSTYTNPNPGEQVSLKSPHGSNLQRASGFEDVVQISLHFARQDFGMSEEIEPIMVDDKNARVNALIEWQFQDGKDTHSWIVMALEQIAPNDHRQTAGRVLAVNTKNIQQGGRSMAPKVLYRSSAAPVTALCAYGTSSLLFSAGNELMLLKLSYSKKQSDITDKYLLPSPARSITCQGPIIFIATSHHSLVALIEKNGKLELHKTDIKARNASDVVAFGDNSALLSSFDDRGTHLVAFAGFSQAATGQPVPIFQADLPLLIDRIQLPPDQTSRGGSHYRFFGSTTDGTIYHLTTLQHDEWKLLHFLEEQSQLYKPAHKPAQVRRKRLDGSVYMWQPPMRLTDLHVRGDRLLMMVETGPYNLRRVLKGQDQLEHFRGLAQPILGADVDDPVEAITCWLRGILRFPPNFSP